jgi:hypothetical protein
MQRTGAQIFFADTRGEKQKEEKGAPAAHYVFALLVPAEKKQKPRNSSEHCLSMIYLVTGI